MIEEPARTSTMIEVLTPIWERVLQRSPIGAEDNFFDLGGDPAAASRLFADLARDTGRELSPLTIYQAPTIATLAAILEEPALPRLSTLVELKAGTGAQPIFMIPGIGGSVMDFFELVKLIDSGHPIYGMQSRGMDGLDEPFERIEDLAQYHVDSIRTQQLRGPYIFIGYSLGGLVALEMAQRLSGIGETVASLIMVETHVSRRYVLLGKHVGLAKRRAKRIVRALVRRAGLGSPVGKRGGESMRDRPEVGEKFKPIMQHAVDIAFLTWQRYRPRHYKGRINYVRTMEIDPAYPDDPSAVWGKLADEFVLQTVPGNHTNVLASHSESLAAALSGYLNEVPR